MTGMKRPRTPFRGLHWGNATATTLPLADGVPVWSVDHCHLCQHNRGRLRTELIPCSRRGVGDKRWIAAPPSPHSPSGANSATAATRSEEHTSELQSLAYLVCRLLLE